MFIFYPNNTTAFRSHYGFGSFFMFTHTARSKMPHTSAARAELLSHPLSLSLLLSVSVCACVSAPLRYYYILLFTMSMKLSNASHLKLNTRTHTHTRTHRSFRMCVYASGSKNLLWYARKLTKLMISLYTANGSIIQNSRRIYRHPRAVQLKSSFYDIAWFPLCIHFWKYPPFDSCHVAA